MTTSSQRRSHSKRLARIVRQAADVVAERGKTPFYMLDSRGKVDVPGAVALVLGCPQHVLYGTTSLVTPWGQSKRATKAWDEFRECLVLVGEYVDGFDLARNVNRFVADAKSKSQVAAMLRKAAVWIEAQD